MMHGYRLQLASDLDRDGMALELQDSNGSVVAEIFEHEETKTRLFNTFDKVSLDPVVLRWLLNRADEEFDRGQAKGFPISSK